MGKYTRILTIQSYLNCGYSLTQFKMTFNFSLDVILILSLGEFYSNMMWREYYLGVKWSAVAHTEQQLSFIFAFIFTPTHSTASFDSPLLICGSQSVLEKERKRKIEVKMTKAFCKLQGFVFTIFSSNMTFSPAACWSFSFFLLFWKKKWRKIPQPARSTKRGVGGKRGCNHSWRWRESELPSGTLICSSSIVPHMSAVDSGLV